MTTTTPEKIEAAVLQLKNATSKDHWPKIATMQAALTAKDARIKELEAMLDNYENNGTETERQRYRDAFSDILAIGINGHDTQRHGLQRAWDIAQAALAAKE